MYLFFYALSVFRAELRRLKVSLDSFGVSLTLWIYSVLEPLNGHVDLRVNVAARGNSEAVR